MSRQPTLSRGAWVVVILLAGLVAAGLQWGPARVSRWRADRTATRFVTALHAGDSAAIGELTPRGKTKGILCARRIWPAAYWSRAGGEPSIERLPGGIDFRYRVVGDTLAERAAPAVFEFYIVPEQPGQVDRYFANLKGTSWSEPFRGCIAAG